jgi:hypothetical protein
VKRQVNEARNVCEQPVIPVRTRKLVGEDKAKRGRRKSWDFASGFLTSRFATNELNRELVKRLRRGVEVKNGNVGAVAGFRSGEPNGGFVARK